MNRGEAWWVDFEPALGGEITKTRPAVIVSNNGANAALNRVIVIPLTSKTAKVFLGEAIVNVAGCMSKALASQLTTVSKARLKNLFGKVSDKDMLMIEKAVCTQLGLPI